MSVRAKKLDRTIRCPSCGAGSSIVLVNENEDEEYCLACYKGLNDPKKKIARS